MIKEIFVDMDGVLCDFVSAIYGIKGKQYREVEYRGGFDDLWQNVGMTEEEMWAIVDHTPDWWRSLKPYPWANDLMELLMNQGVPVRILSTARKHHTSYSGKVQWLEDHGFNQPLILCAEKNLLAGPGRVLVDDKEENVAEWVADGGMGITFPQPWNYAWVTSQLATGFDGLIDPRMGYVEFKLNRARDSVNPKEACGQAKTGLHTTPPRVLLELGAAMSEGAKKYGPYNYRDTAIRSSIYFDAVMRHMYAWWEGEDIDPDSGLPHVVKAMSSLVVLRDSQIGGICLDDRPRKTDPKVLHYLIGGQREERAGIQGDRPAGAVAGGKGHAGGA